MTLITIRGIIIREKAFKDDRILVILTGELGVITAYAKRAMRPKSRLASSTELFTYSQFVLNKSKDQYWVESAQADKVFFGIRQDVLKLALSAYLCELVGALAPKEEEAWEYLRLLMNSFYLLMEDKRPPSQIKGIFELRTLSMGGFMPDLVGCSGCGVFEASPMYFRLLTGDLLCASCREEQGGQKLHSVNPSVLSAFRHVLYSPFEKLFSFAITGESLERFSQISEAYTLCHLDFAPKTLGFYHTILEI